MQLVVRSGEQWKKVADLATGIAVYVGRLETCNVAFPHDLEMSGRHLMLEALPDGTCYFRDQGSTNGSFLNEKPVTEGVLTDHDVLRCGDTNLSVSQKQSGTVSKSPSQNVQSANIQPTPKAASHSLPIIGSEKTGTTPRIQSPKPPQDENLAGLAQTKGYLADEALAIWTENELKEDVPVEPRPGEAVADFAMRLAASQDDNSCLKFLSAAMPKRPSVWWLTLCIRSLEEKLVDPDLELLDVVEAWVKDPSESNRRRAMAIAQKMEFSNGIAWAGVAAFWAHGSMAPPDAPFVPPAPNLYMKAVFGSVALTAVQKVPEKAPERRQQFTDLAVRIANGTLSWE